MSTRGNAGVAAWGVAAIVLLLVALCWWWIVAMAWDMYGPMTGAAAWMMTRHWDWPHMALLFAMWSAMMVGMMLPSAVAVIVGYGLAPRGTPATRIAPMGAFVAAYALVWMLFSLAATLAQRAMYASRLLSPMMEPVTTVFAGGLLLAAGIYQLLPVKRTCLAWCRGLAGLPRQDWTVAEAFRVGVRYGRACLASNWLLMLLLFAGGVMNLALIAALTGVVLVEKVAPLGMRSTWVTGGVLVGLSLWLLG